ncbi:MAG: hypothetical protein EBU90_22590 [Proteobacteria bacterium]|nr:hypothetical protein [Pseudomonadota bacterium]
MTRWKKGESIYGKFIANLAEYVSEQCEMFAIKESGEHKVVEFARVSIVDFIHGLTVEDLLLMHEYLMYMTEMRLDPRFPTYVYAGGDRIAAVTRYLQKNIDLELAKCYA